MPLNLFIPISKIDAAKRLVYGTISEETPDKSGEILDYESAKPEFQKWSDEIDKASNGKSKGNLRSMHTKIAAGKFTDIKFDDENKRIEGVAKVVDDDEWAKVQEGVYTGFSIGGGYAKRWNDPADPTLTRYTPTLSEVSLVDNPCVPTATFEFIKEDGSVELRKFHTHSKEEAMSKSQNDRPQDTDGVMQKWVAKDGSTHFAKADALRRNAEIEAEAAADPMKAAIEKAAKAAPSISDGDIGGDGMPKPVSTDTAQDKKEAATGETLDGKPVDGTAEDEGTKKTMTTEQDQGAASKAEGGDDEAEKARKAEEAKKVEAEKAAEADEVAKAKDSKKEPYGDVEYADPGYQKDKKKRYPLDTEKHIRAAWNYINKKKNADKYSADDLDKIKSKIVAAWKEKIDKDGPPSASEKAFRAGNLRKGLHEVARFACLIQELEWLHSCVEFEQECEHDDDSTQAEQLKANIAGLCATLRTMVEEETAELFDDDDDVDVEVMELAAGLPKDGAAAMLKFQFSEAAKAKMAKFTDALAKAGARHSAADTKRVQDLHDTAHDMHKAAGKMQEHADKLQEHAAKMRKSAGAMKNTAIDLGATGEKCEMNDEGGDAQKSLVSGDLAKMTIERDALSKVIGNLTPKVEKMSQVIEEQVKAIEDLKKEKSDLADRLKKIEDQPMPAKGKLRTLSKSEDEAAANGAGKDDPETVTKMIEGMTPEARALLMVKASRMNPVR